MMQWFRDIPLSQDKKKRVARKSKGKDLYPKRLKLGQRNHKLHQIEKCEYVGSSSDWIKETAHIRNIICKMS